MVILLYGEPCCEKIALVETIEKYLYGKIYKKYYIKFSIGTLKEV